MMKKIRGKQKLLVMFDEVSFELHREPRQEPEEYVRVGITQKCAYRGCFKYMWKRSACVSYCSIRCREFEETLVRQERKALKTP